MMTKSHVVYDDSNTIHSNAIVDESVKLGENNFIGPFCVITGNVTIGNNNVFTAHAVIGTAPQSVGEPQTIPGGSVKIGNKNIIREFISIHCGTKRPTTIGNDCFIMSLTHVGHDVQIFDYVILVAAKIAGHCMLMHHSQVGLNSAVHQFTTIGPYAFVGMQSSVVKDVPAYYKVAGCPAKFLSYNEIGMRRNGFSEESIQQIKDGFIDDNIRQFEEIRNKERKVLTKAVI